MKRLAVTGLPDAASEAAAQFYRNWLPRAEALLSEGGDLALCFDPADHAHRGWRRAAVQDLAREAAPARVNGIAGGPLASAAIVRYLEQAPGVTGQYLAGDEFGSGDPAGAGE